MIDWWMVAANSLWILGLSILLSTFSYHDWLARETKRRRRDVFRDYSFRLPWTSGMFLFCAGWGLGQAVRWWERTIWFALAATVAWEMRRLLAAARERSKSSSSRPHSR